MYAHSLPEPESVLMELRFSENEPRPPVPGEEGSKMEKYGTHHSDGKSAFSEPVPDVLNNNQWSDLKKHLDVLIQNDAKILCKTGGLHSSGRCSLQQSVGYNCNGGPMRGLEPDGYSSKPVALEKNRLKFLEIDNSCFESPESEGNKLRLHHFRENCNPVMCVKCDNNYDNLLEDSDGLNMFKEFVENQLGSMAVEFWMICKGMKKIFSNLSDHNTDKIQSLVQTVCKKFLRGNKLGLSAEVKQFILDKRKSKDVNETIFDEALKEVKANMRDNYYPLFLKSDSYMAYVECKLDSSCSSSSSSECSSQNVSNSLQTVNEEEEMKLESPSLSLLSLMNLQQQLGGYNMARHGDGAFSSMDSINYSSCPMVSAQDSELQSLSVSSGAITDDTVSLTDTIGSCCVDRSNHWQRKPMRQNPDTAHFSDLNLGRGIAANFVKERNIAEREPRKFAALLTERLVQAVSCHKSNSHEEECHMISDEKLSSSSLSSRGGCNVSLPISSMLKAINVEDPDDSAESILERHMSRVFEGSSGQTPTISSGIHSPERCRHSPNHLKSKYLSCRANCFSRHDQCSLNRDEQQAITESPFLSKPPVQPWMNPSDGTADDIKCIQMRRLEAMHPMRQPFACYQDSPNDKVMMWMQENDKMKPQLTTGSSSPPSLVQRPRNWSKKISFDRGSFLPSQPFIQDPSMPLLAPPDPMTQLEEAKRRLEQEAKSRMFKSNSSSRTKEGQAFNPSGCNLLQVTSKTGPVNHAPCTNDQDQPSDVSRSDKAKKPTCLLMNQDPVTFVVYYFCEESTPYLTKLFKRHATLADFKQLVAKKGHYKYFFKTASNEFETGFVYEEICDNDVLLPVLDGKISAKVSRFW